MCSGSKKNHIPIFWNHTFHDLFHFRGILLLKIKSLFRDSHSDRCIWLPIRGKGELTSKIQFLSKPIEIKFICRYKLRHTAFQEYSNTTDFSLTFVSTNITIKDNMHDIPCLYCWIHPIIRFANSILYRYAIKYCNSMFEFKLSTAVSLF
jgi:hypothetical protein